jgi:hypothetical protein
VKAVESTPTTTEVLPPNSRKRKSDSVIGDYVLLIDAGGEDYFDEQRPTASTSRRAVFGPDTPPTTPHKPDLDTKWQKEKVKAHLRLKAKRDDHSSPKKSRYSSRRSESSSDRKHLNPYVKLTRLDDDQGQLTPPRPQSTTKEAVAQTASSRQQ